MSITDELRNWWVRKFPVMDKELHEDFTAIADRIDAEHEKECARSWMRGYDAWAAIDRSDEMAEHGWMRMPKDADGEYIHMGDRMENGELVVRIVLTDGSWEPTVYTAATPNQLHEYYCHDIRHYREPSVEDVLREMLYKAHIYDEREMELLPDIIAEYAAKLRLANDGEEQ